MYMIRLVIPTSQLKISNLLSNVRGHYRQLHKLHSCVYFHISRLLLCAKTLSLLRVPIDSQVAVNADVCDVHHLKRTDKTMLLTT